MLSKLMQLFRRPPPETESLQAVLEERAEVVERKQRVLKAFWETQTTLGERRRRAIDHRPERRGV